MPHSYACEIQTDNSGRWHGNNLRFATEEQAQKYVRDLWHRWILVRSTRVVPSEDAPNSGWDDEIGLTAFAPPVAANPAESDIAAQSQPATVSE